MILTVISSSDAYLAPAPLIDCDAPEVEEFARRLADGCDPKEAATRCFHFVRDEVSHSWDAQRRRVPRSASETLRYREGICYQKSHLLAALLRACGIPAGICYQRLTLFDDASGGYAVHALNAVYLDDAWHRIDARGNKPGVAGKFSLGAERLAFPVRPEHDEIDYPMLYAAPHLAIVETLAAHDDALEMYLGHLPAHIE